MCAAPQAAYAHVITQVPNVGLPAPSTFVFLLELIDIVTPHCSNMAVSVLCASVSVVGASCEQLCNSARSALELYIKGMAVRRSSPMADFMLRSIKRTTAPKRWDRQLTNRRLRCTLPLDTLLPGARWPERYARGALKGPLDRTLAD